MFSKLIFDSPWYYVLICLLAGLLLAGILYYRNKKNTDVPRIVTASMFVVRSLTVSLILLLLLNIFLRRVSNETQDPIVLVAIDNSKSIVANADSAFVKKEFAQQLEEVRKKLGDKFSIKTILFGSSAKTTDENPSYTDNETDIASVLNDVENNYSNRNVGALILVSDGIYNKGVNPVYSAEKLGYPVYTIAMGDTNEIKDAAIQKTDHNQFAYLGNIFPVEVLVNVKKFSGKEVNVSLFNNGVLKGEQKLKVSSDNFSGTCNFTLSADVGGVQKYTSKISVLEGEQNISNNTQSFLIDVIDNRIKVLMVSAFPHPDIAAVREVISANPAYELKVSLAADFRETVKPYSLVIFHGYSTAQSQLLADCKSNNIPYWMIAPQTTENLNGVRISSSFNRQNDAEPVLNPSFGLFNISDELKNFIKDLPAVKTVFGNYSISNGVVSLLDQKIGVVETENPVFIFNELGGLKSAAFLGDGLWKWKMRDFAEHTNTALFSELVSKTIQYLSLKSDKSFFRIAAPKIVNENEAVEINAEVYNKSYELITDPEVSLVVTNEAKKQFNYAFSKINNAYKLNLGYMPAGEYRYEAKVKVNGEVIVKQGVIIVKEIVSEKINTVANHQLLFQLSARSGGKLFYPKEISKLPEEIEKNQLIKPITYSSAITSAIIELKWLFYTILFLLTLEWFFRKRYLSI